MSSKTSGAGDVTAVEGLKTFVLETFSDYQQIRYYKRICTSECFVILRLTKPTNVWLHIFKIYNLIFEHLV